MPFLHIEGGLILRGELRAGCTEKGAYFAWRSGANFAWRMGP